MAKMSIIKREEKREQLEEKYRQKRALLKTQLGECYAALVNTDGEHGEVYEKIDALQRSLDLDIPRNATPKRKRNRCRLTGRARGVYRKFKLGRSALRKVAMMGLVPGVRKSSW
ncbi:MAG: 30S ribosomal protein S14 [Gammaproteobacteria bacterium]|nr:30S ribosomal protein S14 [Gammaproteobacteria bacterium]